MTKRNVLITIQTQRQAIRPPTRGFMDDEYDEEGFPLEEPEPDPSSDGDDTSELLMEGRLVTTTHRVELVYQESELPPSRYPKGHRWKPGGTYQNEIKAAAHPNTPGRWCR